MKKIWTTLLLVMIVMLTSLSSYTAANEVDCSTVEAVINEEACQEGSGTPLEESEEVSEPLTESSVESLPEQNLFMMFIQMFAALGLVIGLIFVIFRFVNGRTRSFRSTQVLQNLGGVPLGANRSVQLIKVGGRLFVVGVGESIHLIKEIDDVEEVEALQKQRQPLTNDGEDPLSKMNQWLRRKKKVPSESPYHTKDGDEKPFKQLLSRQMKDVQSSQERIRQAMREQDKS